MQGQMGCWGGVPHAWMQAHTMGVHHGTAGTPEQHAHKVRQDGVCAGLQAAARQQSRSIRAGREGGRSSRQNSSSCSYIKTRCRQHSAAHPTPPTCTLNTSKATGGAATRCPLTPPYTPAPALLSVLATRPPTIACGVAGKAAGCGEGSGPRAAYGRVLQKAWLHVLARGCPASQRHLQFCARPHARPHLQRDEGCSHAQQVEVGVGNDGASNAGQLDILQQQQQRRVGDSSGRATAGIRSYAQTCHLLLPPLVKRDPALRWHAGAPAAGPACAPPGCSSMPGMLRCSRTGCQTAWPRR
jgi:hypothetical protein